MKSKLLLLCSLPSLLTACQGEGLDPYYSGSPPDISSISVESEPGNVGGQVVTLSGSGFGDDPNKITVVFGGNNAELLSVSDSSIELVVPRGPLEGGAVDVRVGTEGGQSTAEGLYTYDVTNGEVDDDFYADQIAYVNLSNDYYSCYLGIGRGDVDSFCEDDAFVGLTGVDADAQFLTFAFPRVHTQTLGSRFGYGTSTDWSFGEWYVEKPTQDFIEVDIEQSYEDYRIEIESFEVRNPSFVGEPWWADMSTLAEYRYEGGDTVETDDGTLLLAPYSVTSLSTLVDEADPNKGWTKEYDQGVMEVCMTHEYDTPRTFKYAADWPVGRYFFEADGRPSNRTLDPVAIEVDIPDIGVDDVEIVVPNRQYFYNTAGSATAGTAQSVDWNLYQVDSSCPDTDGDGYSSLSDAVWAWEWEPMDPSDLSDGSGIVDARTYVRMTVSVLTLGWYGGSGIPIRATLTVPDFHNYDESTGFSSLELPASVFYQFPTSNYDAGPVTDPLGNVVGYQWADPARSDYANMVFVLERVTEYKLDAGYEDEFGDSVDGSVIVATTSGEIGFFQWSNPLDNDGCGNCIDDDGDGWVDNDDPDCRVDDATEEDNSTFGDSTCNDGEDNNGDGLIDSEDPECADGTGGESNCDDGEDNDGDGYVDDADAECGESGSGFELGEDDDTWGCLDGLDNDEDGWTDIEDPDCVTNDADELGFGDTACNNDADDDGHGDVDSADLTCLEEGAAHDSEEPEYRSDCIDEADNDEDGYTDGYDPDCELPPYAFETRDYFEEGEVDVVLVCYNGVDDDGDGFIDGDDPGCINDAGEPDGFWADERSDFPGYTTCEDLADNDGDGWIDLDDPGCQNKNDVEDDGYGGASQCNDGSDNDGDSLTDAEDPECADAADDDEEN